MAERSKIEAFLKEVGRQNGFRGMDPATLERFAAYFEPQRVEVGRLPDALLDDVLVLGTANAMVTTSAPIAHDTALLASVGPAEDNWIQVAVLRGGAALSARPLRAQVFGEELHPLDEQIDVVQPGDVWRMDPAALTRFEHDERLTGRRAALRSAVVPLTWAPGSMGEWLRVFVLLEWINRSADLQLLTPPQRLALARTARLVHSRSWTGPLTVRGKRSKELVLLGPGMTATVRQARGEDTELLTGALVGWSAFSSDKAPFDVEIGTPGWMLTWSEPSLARRLFSLGPLAQSWVGRFCKERHRVYSYAPSIIAGLRRTELLRDVPRRRLAPLLQGASAVTWRVGAPPPVPVGLESGLCVITEGEVVTYQMLADRHRGAVTMVRVEPVAAHRGCLPEDPPDMHDLDTLGEDEVAQRLFELGDRPPGEEGKPPEVHLLGEHMIALASNRWTARVPSRGVFVPTWRLRRVLDDLFDVGVERLVDQAAATRSARHTMASLDASEGAFRDDLNLVWVTRHDGAPPSDTDRRLLRRVLDRIAAPLDQGGFGERSLLVELVRSSGERRPGSWVPTTSRSEPVEGGTLATEAERELQDLSELIRQRRGACNVVVFGDGELGGDVVAAADTALLMNHDPSMKLTGWPRVDTPVQVANLVRAEPRASLPPVTVRLHGLLEEHTPDAGFAGCDALMGRWARALTHRRVGVALGGGGAWGWAHVALIEGMFARGIPIDILSGASFGAVAGGIYALGGLPALTWAVQHDGRLQLATNGSMVLGWPMAKLLDGLIDDLEVWSRGATLPSTFDGAIYRANLEAMRDPKTRSPTVQLVHLPTPFYPVATELVTGSEAPLLRGTVGHGVRASGSLPPVFPTTRVEGATFADGGLSRNVPANVLLLEGAAVVVGANIVPPPFFRTPAQVVRGRIGATLTALDPLRRTIDSVVGAQTLFNQAGAVDTGLSPVLFQTEWNGSMFFQISRGEDIVQDTRGERTFWQALNGLARRWQSVQQPRRGVDPVATSTAPAQGPQDPVG